MNSGRLCISCTGQFIKAQFNLHHPIRLYLFLTNSWKRGKGPRISSYGPGLKSQDSILESFCIYCTQTLKRNFINWQPKPVMNVLLSFCSLCMQWDRKLQLNIHSRHTQYFTLPEHTSNKKSIFSILFFFCQFLMYITLFLTLKSYFTGMETSVYAAALAWILASWSVKTREVNPTTLVEQPGEQTELLREALEHPTAKTAVSRSFFVENKKEIYPFIQSTFVAFRAKLKKMVLHRCW